MDWKKWMEDHHVRLRGDPNDYGSDEVHAGGDISRSKVASKVSTNAGKTGCSDIQKSVRARQTKKEPKSKKEGTGNH